mmetsp:Transcript_151407/g.282264  ORF Transcript_151407/g.282264 Transcript_151407/m.282264 type:complete len:188 (+) Transcript_151407:74-637(+)
MLLRSTMRISRGFAWSSLAAVPISMSADALHRRSQGNSPGVSCSWFSSPPPPPPPPTPKNTLKGLFDDMNLPSNVKELMPTGTAISAGTIVGFCAGLALKKIAMGAAVIFGGIFCFLQGLHYLDYARMNWEKVEHDMIKVLDTNGDGVIDDKDFNAIYLKVYNILSSETKGLSGGFAGGFLYGIKKG